MKAHRHYWFYPWVIWSGTREHEVTVSRYCRCGQIQAAARTDWKPASKRREPDLVEFCRLRIKRGVED